MITIVTNGQLPAAKATLKPTPPEIEAIMPDPLTEVADAVWALGNEAAALATMRELLARQALNYVEQGAVLLRIKDKGWFGTYGSFEAICLAEFGVRKYEADRLIAIYVMLVDGLLPWADLKELGWPKFSMLCAWLYADELLPEEFTTRLEEAKRMTVVELRQSLKKLVHCVPIEVKTSTDKPHEDQAETIAAAIDKAEEEAVTEYYTVALEKICGHCLATAPELGAVEPAGFATAVEKTDGPGETEPAAHDIDDNRILE